MCCDQLGIRSVMEQVKKHPRDFFSFGRLKVELVNAACIPTNKQIGRSKRKLYAAIGEQIKT